MKLPEKFDLSLTEKYILVLEISDEIYSFSIYNSVEEGSIFHHEVEKKLGEDAFSAFENFYYENEFLSNSYHKIFVVNNTANFTFVPTNVFDEKKKDEFFRFNFSGNQGKVLAQTLNKPEITILHSIPEKAFDFFNRTFVNLHFVHHISPLLSYFAERTRIGNTHRLIVNMQNEGLDVLYFAPSGEFIFANHFKCSHLNDAVYYIFFIWKQFNLNQLKDFIYVAGNSSQTPDLIKQLQKYVQNVFPVEITSSELLSLTLCEL
ncbi:MAG: DUF3822 family protein [Dysgonamonadaceae bacterium]|jgi:hypothetical protein|nr:DUF3822 family protein [Dysgonamonadaceae bacterium]